MSKEIPQVLKGFRDYLPQEQAARTKIISKISEIFERFGFVPLDTPALEEYQLFKGKIGEDEKLMYKFEDLGGREVALRYEFTVPLVRIINQYPELAKPFKRYQIGLVWRAEKPQKGRYRELVQCDIDIVGTDSKLADMEVIAAMYAAYKNLEVGNFLVKYNNRELVNRALKELGVKENKVPDFIRSMDKLDKIGEQKTKELLEEQGFDANLFEGYSDLMNEIAESFVVEMESTLSGMGVDQMKFDKYLMRGQDYYTGTIFEFVLSEKPEFGSVGGGGRYDKLIGKITGKDMPAVGGSIGLDRLFAALTDAGSISPQTAAEVIVFNLDEKLIPQYLNLATNLRNAGIDTEFYYETAKLDKQFKYAESKNIQVAVIMGPDEAGKRQVNVKNLVEKKQVTVDIDDLATEIKSMLW